MKDSRQRPKRRFGCRVTIRKPRSVWLSACSSETFHFRTRRQHATIQETTRHDLQKRRWAKTTPSSTVGKKRCDVPQVTRCQTKRRCCIILKHGMVQPQLCPPSHLQPYPWSSLAVWPSRTPVLVRPVVRPRCQAALAFHVFYHSPLGNDLLKRFVIRTHPKRKLSRKFTVSGSNAMALSLEV